MPGGTYDVNHWLFFASGQVVSAMCARTFSLLHAVVRNQCFVILRVAGRECQEKDGWCREHFTKSPTCSRLHRGNMVSAMWERPANSPGCEVSGEISIILKNRVRKWAHSSCFSCCNAHLISFSAYCLFVFCTFECTTFVRCRPCVLQSQTCRLNR